MNFFNEYFLNELVEMLKNKTKNNVDEDNKKITECIIMGGGHDKRNI